MQPSLLLDYEFAVSQSGFVVRALLTLEGRAPEAASRVPLDLSVVLDRSGSMAGEKLAAAREAADLEAMAQRFATEEVSAADAKYLGQRAYNTYRKKEAYGEKLARGRRPRDS